MPVENLSDGDCVLGHGKVSFPNPPGTDTVSSGPAATSAVRGWPPDPGSHLRHRHQPAADQMAGHGRTDLPTHRGHRPCPVRVRCDTRGLQSMIIDLGNEDRLRRRAHQRDQHATKSKTPVITAGNGTSLTWRKRLITRSAVPRRVLFLGPWRLGLKDSPRAVMSLSSGDSAPRG